MSVQEVSVATSDDTFARRSGTVCLWGAVLGAASGVFLAVVPAQVDSDVYSYPLENMPFAAIQVFFFIQHLALLIGVIGLWRSGATGSSWLAKFGVGAAVAGMGLLALLELAAITVANAAYPGPRTDLFDAFYGVASLVIGAGLVLAGVAVLRTRLWHGWPRWIPLAAGIYVFVPMIPAIMGPFVLARLSIAGWMLLFAMLGWALMRSSAPGSASITSLANSAPARSAS